MHTAFLLAAGLGTRLRPLTLVRPKPLLPVCGVPMLDHALAHVRNHGHQSVIVNAHYLWEQVAAWAVQNGVEVQVELPAVLGTGGGLRAAMERLDPAGVVVVNADVLSDVDLGALLAAMPPEGGALALREIDPGAEITPVEADAEGLVRRIGGLVEGEGGIPGTHFTGVYALSGAALARVPDPRVHGESCIKLSLYGKLTEEGKLGAILHHGAWVDIGTPEAYLQANLDALTGRLKLPVDPWSRGSRAPGMSWAGAGAEARGDMSLSVIGARAIVPRDATLSECVVWDGLTVPPGDHHRTVFYGRGPGPAQVLKVG